MSFNNFATVPFTQKHGGIVIGKGGNTITAIKKRFVCNIDIKTPDPSRGFETHCFLISGPTMDNVNRATIEIYRLLNISLMKSDAQLRKDLDEVSEQFNHLKLVMEEKSFETPEPEEVTPKIPDPPKKRKLFKKKPPPPLNLDPDTPDSNPKKIMLSAATDDEDSDSDGEVE